MTPSSPIKIIVVDDDLDDHYLFKDAFSQLKLNAELIQLYNGSELLEYLKQNRKNKGTPAEVIIMDINMPTMNGIEALQQIKNDASFRTIPVYILSTAREDVDYTKCKQLGAADFFIKPNSSKEFYDILSRIFFNKGLAQ